MAKSKSTQSARPKTPLDRSKVEAVQIKLGNVQSIMQLAINELVGVQAVEVVESENALRGALALLGNACEELDEAMPKREEAQA